MKHHHERLAVVVVLAATDDPLVKNHGTAAGREPAYRLRLALKHFLRSYGLKCTSAAPGPTEPKIDTTPGGN